MKNLLKKINQLLAGNTTWLYLTLIWLISYTTITSETHDNLPAYLLYFVEMTSLYLPFLLYITYRRQIKNSVWPFVARLFWVFFFLAYPVLISTASDFIADTILWPSAGSSGDSNVTTFAVITGLITLLTELAFIASKKSFFSRSRPSKSRFSYIGLDEMLLGLIILSALYAALIATWQLAGEVDGFFSLIQLFGQYIWAAVQFAFIFATLYFYYHVNKYVLIPGLLTRRTFIRYSFAVAALILITYPLFTAIIQWLPITTNPTIDITSPTTAVLSHDDGFMPLMVIFLTTPLILSNNWLKRSNRIANLEKEKSGTELRLLRQYINPHFFFNTLNNLYAMVVTKDDRTADVVMQLSELMRYTTYKGQQERVALAEEVKYIGDYIELQQIRIHKELDFVFEQHIDNPQQPVPPLLFINLVENAFKHGIEPSEESALLHLQLQSNEKQLVFSCYNSVKTNNDIQQIEEGSGLQNLRRRLELLFPNSHELTTKLHNQTFEARLVLRFDTTMENA